MWGDKTKYYLFPFLAGIAVSKICFSFSNDNVHNFTTFNCVIIAVILPLLLLSLMTYYLYNRQYDNIFYSAVVLLFILGYNSHHFYNTNRIEIKSDLIICIKNQCIDMCDGLSSKYAYYVKALLFGERSGIPNAEKDLFIKTGTLHLFALSGLHAGIVYSMIYYAFYPFKLFKAKWVHPYICCTSLILYAIISGSSSSVMRAAVMITIYNISKIALINGSKGNVLLTTAFILSLLSPNSIFEAGFQLSFAAMFGIFYIYPYLKRCIWNFNLPKPIRYLLNLSSITLSCQISTFPISLFYFGSISPVFILGNIVAVPLVSIIIYVSICTLILQRTLILFHCMDWLLTLLFDILLYIINLLGN